MKQLIIIAFLLTANLSLSAQQTTIEEDIRQMMELSGAGKLGIQVMEAMSTQFQRSLPEVPTEFWKEVMKEVNPDKMIDLIIPIYKKHFTQAEVQQLITFYKSPIGQKVSATLPAVTAESMEVGEQWGQEIAAIALKRLQEKGYIKN